MPLDLYYYLECFEHLDTCRNDSLMPIFWTAIKDYAVFNNIQDFDFFYTMINEIDKLILKKRIEHVNNERKKAESRAKKKL